MTDGVFPASGRIAPVADYRAVLRRYKGAAICLDDAHAIGVLGEHGRGTFEHAGFRPDRVNTLGGDADGVGLFFTGTLSKAIGGFGGIFPGAEELVARLKTRSHFYDGASQPPAPAAAATACALRMVMARPALRRRLRENTRTVKAGLRKLGLNVDDTPVPIVGLGIGSADNMQRIERGLRGRGIILPYVASYSGVAPQGLLRIAVFASHTRPMLRQLVDELGRLL
jgi:7-keto-8-aminopelargonate synthetase-like enzyme